MGDYPLLSLHVPEPAVRPGDTPDFSNVQIAEAGSVARPEVDADPETIRDHAFSVIRVLNRTGEAVGPWRAAERHRGAAAVVEPETPDEPVATVRRRG